MFYYGVLTSAANAALENVVETIRLVTATPDEKAYAYSLIDAAVRTHQAVASTGKRDSHASYASKPRRSSTEKSESPSASYTHVASTSSQQKAGAISSTEYYQPYKTNESKAKSPQLTKHKQLHILRPTSLDMTNRTSPATSQT
jgi:hypothetical protein